MALLTGVATALVFFLVLLSGTALFFGGQYAGLLGNGLSVLAGDWPPDCWEAGRKSPENTGEKLRLVKLYKKEQGGKLFLPLAGKNAGCPQNPYLVERRVSCAYIFGRFPKSPFFTGDGSDR